MGLEINRSILEGQKHFPQSQDLSLPEAALDRSSYSTIWLKIKQPQKTNTATEVLVPPLSATHSFFFFLLLEISGFQSQNQCILELSEWLRGGKASNDLRYLLFAPTMWITHETNHTGETDQGMNYRQIHWHHKPKIQEFRQEALNCNYHRWFLLAYGGMSQGYRWTSVIKSIDRTYSRYWDTITTHVLNICQWN